jgi:hypothetical protein
MIVTIEWMEEWFRRFDQEYFGGKLPVPELGLTHAKTRLGQLAYKRASRWGRTKLYDFKLSMSTYYDTLPHRLYGTERYFGSRGCVQGADG